MPSRIRLVGMLDAFVLHLPCLYSRRRTYSDRRTSLDFERHSPPIWRPAPGLIECPAPRTRRRPSRLSTADRYHESNDPVTASLSLLISRRVSWRNPSMSARQDDVE